MIFDLLALALASISVLAYLMFLLLLIKVKKTRKGFADSLICLNIVGILFHLHWMTVQKQVFELAGGLCYGYGMMNVLLYFLFWNYSSMITVQLWRRIRDQDTQESWAFRAVAHFTCSAVALGETAAALIVGSVGRTGINTCFCVEGTYAQIVLMSPLGINIPLGVFVWIKYCLAEGLGKKVKRISYLNLSILISWGIPVFTLPIIFFLHPLASSLLYFQLFSSSSGILLFTFFCLHPVTIHQLKSKEPETEEIIFNFKNDLRSALNTSNVSRIGGSSCLRSSSLDLLGNFLEDKEKIVLKIQSFIKLLVLIIARFSGSQNKSPSESGISLKKHVYQEMVFKEMEQKSSIAYFTKCTHNIVEFSKLTLKELWCSDLESIREENSIEDIHLFESLIHYSNFYFIENFNGEILNYLFCTNDKRFCLRMIDKKSFGRAKDALQHLMKRKSLCMERVFAVFEVEGLNRFLIVTEGIYWNLEGFQTFKINCLDNVPIVQINLDTGEKMEGLDCDQIFVDGGEVLEEVKRELEFCGEFRLFGYTVVVFKYFVESLNWNEAAVKIKKGQVLVRITDLFQNLQPGAWLPFNIQKNNKNSKTYKEQILESVKSFLKVL